MYNDLKLDRDNIRKVIEIYAKNNYETYEVKKDKKSPIFIRYNLILDKKRLFLDFHFNNKGGTTIQVSNGKEVEEKIKIAEYISSHELCFIASKEENNRSLLFKDIDEKDFEAVIESLTEDKDFRLVSSNKQEKVRTILKLEGQWSDTVTVTYTNSTRNVRIQGRPLLLYNELSSSFNEIIDVDKVVENLESNFKEGISDCQIEEQYKSYLPYSHDKHTEKLKKSLLRAVYNLNISDPYYTCTDLTFEPLRALEGHIKITLFNDYDVDFPNKRGGLHMFKFDKQKKSHKLKDTVRSQVSSVTKIKYYEKAYKWINEYRHEIFHWQSPNELGEDETIQYDDLDQVKEIIKGTLEIIDEYYMLG